MSVVSMEKHASRGLQPAVTWPERDSRTRRRQARSWAEGLNTQQILAFACVVLAAVVISLTFVAGLALIKQSDLSKRVDQQQEQINQQQAEITRLEAQTGAR